ncbi:MAG TPA: DUF1707 domain-containing protein [Trebonia sp.]|jgi:hypothetical protein|nr:DUF1707 domain-containing protein [Trebonia sp.]
MASPTDRPRVTRTRPGAGNQHLRVSDADRGAVADLLARHYGDGRLDETEFDQRVTAALAARTGGDFRGLFDDLPDLPDTSSETTSEPVAPLPRRVRARRRRRHGPVFPGLLLLVLVVVTWHHFLYWGGRPWAWLVILLAAVVMLAARSARRP